MPPFPEGWVYKMDHRSVNGTVLLKAQSGEWAGAELHSLWAGCSPCFPHPFLSPPWFGVTAQESWKGYAISQAIRSCYRGDT